MARMHTQNRTRSSAPQRSFSLMQAGFWMSFCISVSFAAVYLQELGYSNGALGCILALGSTMGIAVSLSLSAWIDREAAVTARKLVPWVLALQTASVAALPASSVSGAPGVQNRPAGACLPQSDMIPNGAQTASV